jgi:esterase/lipase superfamily enzyme
MLAEAQPLQPAAYVGAMRAALAEQPPDQREAVIFVHGFNTAFIEGVYRTAQIANDLHLPGVVTHYSWPSLGAPLAYAYDRDSALFARDGLIDMIRRTAEAGPQRILLIAHSMGSHLVMEALRQMALSRDPAFDRIGGVVLIAPDIDVDLFRQQASAIDRLPQPFLIVISQRDRVLTLSARLTGETSRLGNLQSGESVADLPVTLVDVTAFGSGDGHFTLASSPALIGLLRQLGAVNLALNQGATARLPLLPGALLTLQNASEVILTPPDERRRRLFPWFGAQPG